MNKKNLLLRITAVVVAYMLCTATIYGAEYHSQPNKPNAGLSVLIGFDKSIMRSIENEYYGKKWQYPEAHFIKINAGVSYRKYLWQGLNLNSQVALSYLHATGISNKTFHHPYRYGSQGLINLQADISYFIHQFEIFTGPVLATRVFQGREAPQIDSESQNYPMKIEEDKPERVRLLWSFGVGYAIRHFGFRVDFKLPVTRSYVNDPKPYSPRYTSHTGVIIEGFHDWPCPHYTKANYTIGVSVSYNF